MQWRDIVNMYEGDRADGACPYLERLTAGHVQLTSRSCMSVPLATGVMSVAVANHLRTLGEQGVHGVEGLEQFVRATATIWKCTGDGWGKAYTDVADPRFAELKQALQWFYGWRHAVYQQPLSPTLTKEGRNKQFLSWETWFDMNLTVQGFLELCAWYLPTAPAGCGIKNCRLSQDPCENYFNFMRTSGGSSTAPTTVDARASASARQEQSAMSKKANCAPRGKRARMKYVYDDRCEAEQSQVKYRRVQYSRRKDDA
eukprot:COSAG01_NODE_967_length_12384_cov_3.880505_6_plen_257_part_00